MTERRPTGVVHRLLSMALVSALVAAGAVWIDVTRPRHLAQSVVPAVNLLPAVTRAARAIPHYRTTIPVLTYHAVSDTDSGEYTLRTAEFAAQMAALRQAGLHSVSLAQVENFVLGLPVDLPDRPVMIAFDDGTATDWTVVDPVLKRYGFRAVAFVITGSVAERESPSYYLDEAQIDAMQGTGRWELGGHTHRLHHHLPARGGGSAPALDHLLVRQDGSPESLPDWFARVDDDLTASQDWMRDRFGRTASAFSYPFGAAGQESNDRRVATELPKLLAAHGYRIAFTGDIPEGTVAVSATSDPYRLPRMGMRRVDTAADLVRRIATSIPTPMPRDATALAWTGTGATCRVTRTPVPALAVTNTTAFGACLPVANTGLWRDYTFSAQVVGASRSVTAVVALRHVPGDGSHGRAEIAVGESTAVVREIHGKEKAVLARISLSRNRSVARATSVHDLRAVVSGSRLTVTVDRTTVTVQLPAPVSSGGVGLYLAARPGATVLLRDAVLTPQDPA